MRTLVKELNKNKALFVMVTPAVALTLLLCYLPMAGIVLAFKNFRYNLGVFGSPWAGFENFRFFFMSGTAAAVTRNTVLYNIINLATSQALAIVTAVALSELRSVVFKKAAQSAIFLPYFISWTTVGVFAYTLFNYESGVLNTFFRSIGLTPVNVYGEPSLWLLLIPSFNAWKWVGYNSVIYIAAIANVDPQCFESADMDGANVFQKVVHITLPTITPTMIIMLLLQVGRILRGDFQMFYQLIGNNGQLFEMTDVIDTFVFRSLLNSADLGMSSAATFYQSVLCFAAILTVNGIVRKINPDNALF